MRYRPPLKPARDHRGFTYLGVLIAIAILGIGLAGVGTMWRTTLLREKEVDLLFVGMEFRRAIDAYAVRHAGQPDVFPARLEDLLEDRAHAPPDHFLRQFYPDPLTGDTDWGLLRDQHERIVGVFSRFAGAPLKQSGFPLNLAFLEGAASYQDWKFITGIPYQAPKPPQTVATTTPGGPANDPSATPTEPAVPPPPPAPKPRERDCSKRKAFDFYVCEQQRARWGETTVNECLDSAQRRLNACEAGESPLPMLYIRYQ